MLNTCQPTPRAHKRDGQRGMSLVELMVGITVGLIVVSAASFIAATQITDTRRLLAETQLQQDLRAAADIIGRDLRRIGAWSDLARQGVWNPNVPAASPLPNPFLDMKDSEAVDAALIPPDAAVSGITYGYYRNSGATGPFGFKLQDGGIRSLTAGAGWQELTDPRSLQITKFDITLRESTPRQLPCPRNCPGPSSTTCWPTIAVRELVVDIAGRSVADLTVERALRTVVRLRNDPVRFGPGMTEICP